MPAGPVAAGHLVCTDGQVFHYLVAGWGQSSFLITALVPRAEAAFGAAVMARLRDRFLALSGQGGATARGGPPEG